MEIYTNVENSFASYTLRERLPKIIDTLIVENSFDSNTIESLKELKQSIPNARLTKIPNSPFSEAINKQLEKNEYRWNCAPFLFVENYFYYCIYEITNFKSTRIDYFAGIKNKSLTENLDRIETIVSKYSEVAHLDFFDSLKKMIYLNLIGNKVDLSQNQDFLETRSSITCLVDDTIRAIDCIKDAKRIDIVLDNAGEELLLDLLLCTLLIEKSSIRTVVMHFKTIPYFVSDAMESDFHFLMSVLETNDVLKPTARKIKKLIKSGTLMLRSDDFWCSNLLFSSMPRKLTTDLSNTDLLINKGDLNYRKLVGDIKYDPTERIANVTEYLPFNCLNIRILKSEVVLGIPKSRIEDKINDEWMYDGKNGIIQFCEKKLGRV